MSKWIPWPGFWSARSLPEPISEFKVCPERRWRFDWAFPVQRVAIEVNGGIFSRIRGRHSRGAGQLKDWEKLNHAQKLGWKVFQFSPQQMNEEKTAEFLREVLKS